MKSLKNKKYVKGFTLIEVMMVVAIVGVISAIAIPSYTEYVPKSQKNRWKRIFDSIGSTTRELFCSKLKLC